MANLKKRRHTVICPKCNGNGYMKVKKDVSQCDKCDSEGEYYVYEPETFQPDNNADTMAGYAIKLH
tara:strand:- start:864 stop:1061 length:198 start_codon:yes stop_codon:yes gene_type:complete